VRVSPGLCADKPKFNESALSMLLNAVNANFSGQHGVTPDVAAQRIATIFLPRLAAWDGARQTGATTLLPGEEARMYDRIELNLFVWMEARAVYDSDDTRLQSFRRKIPGLECRPNRSSATTRKDRTGCIGRLSTPSPVNSTRH
jgi:hypothetical protein